MRYILSILLFSFLFSDEYIGSSDNEFQAQGEGVSVSTMYIPSSGTITDLDITLDVDMSSYSLDRMSIQLISPYGTSVELFPAYSNLQNQVLYSTTFDDEASTELLSASPPYFGNFLPSGSLSSFDGETTIRCPPIVDPAFNFAI